MSGVCAATEAALTLYQHDDAVGRGRRPAREGALAQLVGLAVARALGADLATHTGEEANSEAGAVVMGG